MDWKDVAGIVGKAAPLVGTLLGGPPGAVVGGLVASVLGVEAKPDAVAEAMRADPEAALKLAQLQNEHARELRRMALEAAANAMAEETARIREANETYRTELASSDGYARRMRPTFGYVVAGSIAVEVLLAVYVVVFDPAQLPNLVLLFQALAVPQGIALAVLGVYVKKRSDEKALDAGVAPPAGGMLGGLFGRR